MDDDLCFRSATELVAAITSKQLSAREVLDAHLAQIAHWNPVVNAIVTLTEDRARAQAAGADEALARGDEPGPLHGLPIAHKDLVDTAGVRTTYGSPIYATNVPEVDEPFVERIREAGAIMIGKSNTPEFGAGSHTFNAVFGTTRNPYDTTKSAGGSSGGAAAALATGMLPIADGSDLGGSLRNPASFCNVVGFRPTVDPAAVPEELSVDGPMARTVEDVALLLAAMTGGQRIDVRGDVRDTRLAWDPTCGGVFPVERTVVDVVDATRTVFDRLGCETVDASPDLDGVLEVFFTLRARSYATELGELLAEHRDEIKPTVVWNIEQGLAQSDDDVQRALERMRALRRAAATFFSRFAYLVWPVSQVPPFDAELEYPTVVSGEPMETYIDWMASCWRITVLGGPAISVPAGFTDDGLPVGIQIVGRPGDDTGVLRLAHAFEQATGFGRIRPASA
ncbi:MAG: amidase [Actinomycetota bacterium]|nr:amidase [Actinomycetota bacterium]